MTKTYGSEPFTLVVCLLVLLAVGDHPFEQHSRHGQACRPPCLYHVLQTSLVTQLEKCASQRFEYGLKAFKIVLADAPFAGTTR